MLAEVATELRPANAPVLRCDFTDEIPGAIGAAVFDQNASGSRRDDAEVVAPDKTEYQGIFSNGPGTLLIVSCFADACQTDAKTATFEVHYWVEAAPDPVPFGISLLGG